MQSLSKIEDPTDYDQTKNLTTLCNRIRLFIIKMLTKTKFHTKVLNVDIILTINKVLTSLY